MRDIERNSRLLRISPSGDQVDYTCYMLTTATGHHNIEVFVLKDYLREKLGLEFRPRSG